MPKDFSHEPDARRYVLRIDGEIIAVADYSISGRSISFHHTYTNPKKRKQGYAAEIVKFAVDDVESTTDLRVLPMCWFVADWFEKNPERAGLLTR
ncbi:MAG: GNAT family N-acetyltransferase [Lacisediminihabitans sp.]